MNAVVQFMSAIAEAMPQGAAFDLDTKETEPVDPDTIVVPIITAEGGRVRVVSTLKELQVNARCNSLLALARVKIEKAVSRPDDIPAMRASH